MALMESFFKWALIGIVGAMVIVGMVGGALSAIGGMMGNPVIILVVLFIFAGCAIVLVVPGIVGGLWVYRWWRMTAISERRAAEFVAPDEAGRLPVPASLLRTPAFANRAIDSHQASYLANLSTFHYSPESNQNITGADGQTITAAAATVPGSFWQLYQAGRLPDNGFLMGYSLDEDGEEVTADWRKLYSALIGGQSGSGKSTLIRSILAQSALQGGRFVVIDPHYNSGDESLGASLQPLRNLMLCDVASEESQIVDALNYVNAIGQRRLAGQDKERTPIVLVVDETTALLQRSNVAGALTNVLGQIAQETRKAGLYALCIGQNFHSDVMPTIVRDCFVSFISCRARKRVATTMADSNEFGKAAAELTVGQAVWMTPAGDMYRINVPNCTAADLELVAGAVLSPKNTAAAPTQALPLANGHSVSHSVSHSEDLEDTYLERHFPKSRTADRTASELVNELVNDERTTRAIDMFLDGKSNSEIVAELWGATTGDKKVKAFSELNSILRMHMLSLKGR